MARHSGHPLRSGRWDSNPRPSPWQGDVLPLNHARIVYVRPPPTFPVDPVGFEPTISCLQSRRLPARPRALVCAPRDRRDPPATECRREDSNLHAHNEQQILSLQRLPIPPRRQPRRFEGPSKLVGTPDSVHAVIYLTLACARMAAPDLQGVTPLRRRRCGETKPAVASLAHSPCSRLHARLAGDIAAAAGGLLPHRFSPYLVAQAGLLSVAVVVAERLLVRRPHLLFRGATFPAAPGGSREVPLRSPHQGDITATATSPRPFTPSLGNVHHLTTGAIIA